VLSGQRQNNEVRDVDRGGDDPGITGRRVQDQVTMGRQAPGQLGGRQRVDGYAEGRPGSLGDLGPFSS